MPISVPAVHLLASIVIGSAILFGSVQADDTKEPAAEPVKTTKKKATDKQPQAKKRAANAKRQFKRRDKDEDGFLTIKEFIVIPKKLTVAEKIEKRKKAMTRQFGRRDTDKDGKLSSQEFAQELAKRPGGRNAKADKKAPKDKKKVDSE